MSYVSSQDVEPTTMRWKSVLSRTYVPMDCSVPVERKFYGNIRMTDLAALSVTEVLSDPHRITRSKAHISANAPPLYYMNLQMRGSTMVRQGNQEIQVDEGDLVSIDTQTPFEIESFERFGLLCFSVPKMALKSLMPQGFELGAMHVAGASGFARTLQSLVGDVCDGHIAQREDYRLPGAILRILAMAFDQEQVATTRQSRAHSEHHRAVLAYIDKNLTDCDLSVQSVCDHFRISPRYMHKLFEASAETFHQYVQRRRIERCCDAICNHGAKGCNIAQVAFESGFGDLSTFYRAFKRIVGESPRNVQRKLANPS